MKRFDYTFLRFALVGVINTLVGTAIMLFCYNVLNMTYWWSSAANYFFASILSYFLNKNFTFHYGKTDMKSIIRFLLNIVVCYVIAYGLAKPMVRWMLSGTTQAIQENVAMIVGTILFVIINFTGQRFYAFRHNERKQNDVLLD